MNTNSTLDIIKNISQKLSYICKDPQLAEQESWWMLEQITKKNKANLLLEKNLQLTKKQLSLLDLWVLQRTQDKKPLQYILGSIPFCNIEILLESPILIPRPETEEWCSAFIEELKKIPSKLYPKQKIKILDIGSGSGAIALAIAKAFPKFDVYGIDISKQAISLAEKNKIHNNIKNAKFFISNLYETIKKKRLKFDIIISNPPYLSKNEWLELSDEVKLWEDPQALIAGTCGIEIYTEIIKFAPIYLKPNLLLKKYNTPQIVLEIGATQAQEIKNLIEQTGNKITINSKFKNLLLKPITKILLVFSIFKKTKKTWVKIHQDLEGKDRWITARFF